MKKLRKKIIVLLLLLLCSGCTIEYNIEITNDQVKENINIIDTQTTGRTKQNIYNDYSIWYPTYYNVFGSLATEYDLTKKIDYVEYHEKTIEELKNGYKFNYKYIYPIDKFEDAATLRQTYEKRTFYIENEYISISTSKENLLCDYKNFDELIVNISVDEKYYTVSSNNAHEIKDNLYIWKINRENCDDSKILLSIDKKNADKKEDAEPNINEEQKKLTIEKEYTVYLIYAFLIIIIVAVSLFVKKIKENDKFDI